MLLGAGLPPKFWPYAFHHYVRLYNMTAHGSAVKSPFEICTGERPNLRLLRTFGCRVYALPARPKRPDKVVSDTCSGIFLGHTKTMKNALYYDPETESVKEAQHVGFDEVMHDLDEKPPNAQLLAGARSGSPDVVDFTVDPIDFDVSPTPFLELATVVLPLDLNATAPFSCQLSTCSRLHRVFLSTINVSPSGVSLRKFRRQHVGSYLVSLNGDPVFCSADVEAALAKLRKAPAPPATVELVLAPERRSDYDSRPPPLHLRLSDLRRVCALQSIAGEGMSSTEYGKQLHAFASDLSPVEMSTVIHQLREPASLPVPEDLTSSSCDCSTCFLDDLLPTDESPRPPLARDSADDDPALPSFHGFVSYSTTPELSLLVSRLQTSGMTDEEKKLKSFSRRRLMELSNWSTWDDMFDSQWDAHYRDGTLGIPIPRPGPREDGTPPNVLRVQWSNLVKPCGKRKCRACIDGSKRAAPWLRRFGQTYASCIEQPCQRLFFALVAAKGLIVTFGDTTNAFQQSPPPTEPCYLQIDDAYCSWFKKRHGRTVDRHTHVIPVLHALQGHPEAGALWERMIVGILEGPELGFTSTTQERNLYRGTIDGELVLVCRQVDDFAIASESRAAAEKFIGVINSHVTTSSLGIGSPTDNGITARYNGIDVHQTRDYIKLNCETYLDRVLQTHGWDQPSPRESDRFDQVPITQDSVNGLSTLVGPPESTPEHRAIERQAGFSYRQVLGEIIYAYVICRVDIGFAAVFLSRFSQAPALEHYLALKNVVRYLRRTKDWGLVYWRDAPIDSLPAVPLEQPDLDPSLPDFPTSALLDLVASVDASHATDVKTRRSVTGLIVSLAGAAIAYKSKLQPTVATSSTEAEFIAAVQCAKVVKYLRSVLTDLGFPPSGPTVLYEDNQAAIAMINENRPTPRSRHIDIQHFAVQEWRARDIIKLTYIPTAINNADQATKPLPWNPHARHARRSMGHFGPPC